MKTDIPALICNPRIVPLTAWALACMAPGVAQSQTATSGVVPAYPSRAITVVVPFPPGGTSDVLPRMIAPILSRSLGVPVIIDNRPGASGAIGAAIVAKAKPDGHTLLLATPPILATNQWLYKDLAYSPEKDFTPISLVATFDVTLSVGPQLTARTLGELTAWIKANPAEASYGSPGAGDSGTSSP